MLMDNKEGKGHRGTENNLRVWSNGGRDFMLKTTHHRHISNDRAVQEIGVNLMPRI